MRVCVGECVYLYLGAFFLNLTPSVWYISRYFFVVLCSLSYHTVLIMMLWSYWKCLTTLAPTISVMVNLYFFYTFSISVICLVVALVEVFAFMSNNTSTNTPLVRHYIGDTRKIGNPNRKCGNRKSSNPHTEFVCYVAVYVAMNRARLRKN